MTPDTTAPRRPDRSAPRRSTVALIATLVFAVGFTLDQLTKSWALTALADGAVIPVLPTVNLQLAFNPGVAFGMGAEFGPVLAIGLLVIIAVLIGWVAWKIRRGHAVLEVLLLSAVAAGAWGNMFDRITRAETGPFSGHVIDFIAVDWFAIFNVADILTVCGMIAWAALVVFPRRRPVPAAPASTDTSDTDPS